MFSGNVRKFPFSRRSIRTRFAFKFSRALENLNHKRTFSSSLRSYNRRCYMVKMAAYASMASAAGSRRTWSRALLRKIRHKGLTRNGRLSTKTAALTSHSSERLRVRGSSSNEENPNDGELGLDELRRLVPGGEVMDTLSLFDETADYIKCLTVQVQIMRKFVHFYSS